MSYKTNTESKLSFNLPTIIKDELEEYCSVSDRTQSQVLRESIYEYLRYVREDFLDNQVGYFGRIIEFLKHFIPYDTLITVTVSSYKDKVIFVFVFGNHYCRNFYDFTFFCFLTFYV